MVAFIEGHGMRRFHGYVDYEEVQCIMWETADNPEGWKDFVELAKAAGAPFLTMHSWILKREELDEMVQRLTDSEFTDGDDVEENVLCRLCPNHHVLFDHAAMYLTDDLELVDAATGNELVVCRSNSEVVRGLPAAR